MCNDDGLEHGLTGGVGTWWDKGKHVANDVAQPTAINNHNDSDDDNDTNKIFTQLYTTKLTKYN